MLQFPRPGPSQLRPASPDFAIDTLDKLAQVFGRARRTIRRAQIARRWVCPRNERRGRFARSSKPGVSQALPSRQSRPRSASRAASLQDPSADCGRLSSGHTGIAGPSVKVISVHPVPGVSCKSMRYKAGSPARALVKIQVARLTTSPSSRPGSSFIRWWSSER